MTGLLAYCSVLGCCHTATYLLLYLRVQKTWLLLKLDMIVGVITVADPGVVRLVRTNYPSGN